MRLHAACFSVHTLAGSFFFRLSLYGFLIDFLSLFFLENKEDEGGLYGYGYGYGPKDIIIYIHTPYRWTSNT